MTKVYYLIFMLISIHSPLFTMEEKRVEQPRSPLVPAVELEKTEFGEQKFVRLELLDKDNESIHEIRVPYSFAEQASVLNNLLEFYKEEGDVPLPLLAHDITLDQFKMLEQVAHQIWSQHGLVKKGVKRFVSERSPNQIDLINVANYIGHSKLLHYTIKQFYGLLKYLSYENKWDMVFRMMQMVKVPELQTLLKEYIATNPDLIEQLQDYYKKKIEIPISNPFFSTCVAGKHWLAAFFEDVVKDEGTISIINLQTQEIIKKLKIAMHGTRLNREHHYYHFPMKISPSGKELVLCLKNYHTVYVYNIETGQLIKEIDVHEVGAITTICFSDDGSLLAIGGIRAALILDGNNYQPTMSIDGRINYVAFSSDNNRIFINKEVVGSSDTDLEIWKITFDDVILQEEISIPKLMTFIPSPDNKYCACVVRGDESEIDEIEIYDLRSSDWAIEFKAESEEEKEWARFSNKHYYLSFSPDSKFLALGAADFGDESAYFERKVKIWSMQQNRLQLSIPGDYKNIFSLSFSPDGKKLAYFGEKTSLAKFGILYIVELSWHNKLSFEALILLWYYGAIQKKRPAEDFAREYREIFQKIPYEYLDASRELPEKVRKFFYYNSIKYGTRHFPFPYIYKVEEEKPEITFLKERKRKEVSKSSNKKPRRPLRAFKRFKKEEVTKKLEKEKEK